MTRPKIPKTQLGELPRDERVLLAVAEYYSTLPSKGEASFRAIGRKYNVVWTTIQNGPT
jgi:hypothetical protein